MLNLLSVSRFYLAALWRGHPALCASAVVSLVLAISSITALAVVTRRGQFEADQLANLLAAKKVATTQVAQGLVDVTRSQVEQLPTFSSKEFAAQFYETATGVGLPVDEVNYALESNINQFYLRYRVTLTVKTRYPEIRKFIAALAAGMPHVTLDNIQCGRENAAALPLSCQLAFSAFFARK